MITRTRSVLIKVTAVALLAGVAVLLSLALDWTAGMYLYGSRRNAGLIWGPGSTVTCTTREFSYTARINNLGFRDRDFSPGKSKGKRILALGDSYTYGWGVDIADSWPKVLEQNLKIEIANLGSPGGSPRSHADLAEKAIPLLRPDLVLVAVVQADDLHQCSERAPSEQVSPGQRIGALVTDHYPNLLQLIARRGPGKLNVNAQDFAGIWKKQVQDFTGAMSSAERRKFDGLPPAVRAAYLDGMLNPGLLYYSIRFPEILFENLDIESPATRSNITEMALQLGRIRELGEKWGARVLVVSVPYPPYVSERHLAAMKELGFSTQTDLLESRQPDEAIEQASGRAGLPFLAVTDQFRREASRQDLFFLLDGHLNEAGHRVYADLLVHQVRPYLQN